jgi:tRNA pseudouridine55 synthase
MNNINEEQYNGVIIINKPPSITSHDVIYKVRKLINIKRIGHTGTLDPMATGVLPICIGYATKISQYITCETKRYLATIQLGVSTDTFDITGKIISQKQFCYNNNQFIEVLKSFLGEYLQTPPIFSAIKVNGKKLYELARKNIIVEPKKRLVKIHRLDLIKFIYPDKFILDIICSSGTYIRSLCNDIGSVLGVGGILYSLKRTQVGKFSINDSITLEELEKLYLNNTLIKYIIKATDVLNFEQIIVSSKANNLLYNGNEIDISFIIGATKESVLKSNDQKKYFVLDEKKKLIGIYQKNKNHIKPLRLLN